jgi:drug/metabolite transporter (DMT)-like permease
MASVPFLSIFLGFIHNLEKLRTWNILGSLLAVAGIAVVVGGSSSTILSIPHVITILGAATRLAEAGVIAKKFHRNHPIMTSAVAMMIRALILGTMSQVTGEEWIIPTQPVTWDAFGYIAIFVTVIAFFLCLFVLERWRVSDTSYGFVLNMLITIVLAIWLAKERITLFYSIGSLLVLSGVYIGAMLPSKSQPVELTLETSNTGKNKDCLSLNYFHQSIFGSN